MKNRIALTLVFVIAAAAYFFFLDSNTENTPSEPSKSTSKNEELATPSKTVDVDSIVDAQEITPLNHEGLEIPAPLPNELVIKHLGYTVSYNEQHEQANWVAYELTVTELEGEEERSDDFREDPEVTTGSAAIKDYRKSGYDRGHLAPAADMKWSSTAMSESFYFSNMSPQVPGFNRGIWKELEEQVRDWAQANGAIYVVTGGVLKDELPTIGENEVSIPKYYYKILLDYKEPEVKALAFLMPNEKSKEPLSTFVVPINKIEEVTGIDFFPKLENVQEELLESQANFALWEDDIN